MNHFECADLIKQRIVGQKGKLMLKAQAAIQMSCPNPSRFSSQCGTVEHGCRAGLCRDLCDHLAASDQRVHLRGVLLRLPRTCNAEAELSENSLRVAFSGIGKGRAGRSESIAAFASRASRSNCKVVPPERLANGSCEVSTGIFTERRPVATFGCSSIVDGHTHRLVVPNSRKRLSKLENLLFGDVLGLDRSVHMNRINKIERRVVLLLGFVCAGGRTCLPSPDRKQWRDMTEHAGERPFKLRILRAVPVLLVLGLLVHFLLPRLDTIESSLKTLRTMAPWAIGLSFVMEALSYVANGALLKSVVELAGERMSWRRGAAIEIGAGSVALVAAGALGFGAAIYRWARSGGVSSDAAVLASWLPSVFDSASMIVFALISGLELILVHRLSRLTVIALVIVVSLLTVVIVMAIVLLARNDWMRAMAKKVSRMVKRFRPHWDTSGLTATVESAAETWKGMRHGGWLRPAACSLMVVVFDLLCLRYAFLAAGQSLHITLLLAGYGVPILLGRASFLPGGIAVIEVAMIALYGGLGVPASVAVVGVLTYRLISFWLPAILGVPIAITLQSSKQQ
jgi:uncharacterized protein (TIRG00374 family)